MTKTKTETTKKKVVRVGFPDDLHTLLEGFQPVHKTLAGSKPSKEDIVIAIVRKYGKKWIAEKTAELTKELTNNL